VARRRRQTGRKLNGILLLDKPLGISSNKALQNVKKLFNAQKAGHTGSLDPLATGVLPICFGEATKISAFLLDADKEYLFKIKLGEKTTTADSEGEIIESLPIDGIDIDSIKSIIPEFLGDQKQLPPMYSALKHNGERLYKLARQGIEVERKLRDITIYSFELVNFELPYVEFSVHCSKGTYVRTIAEDIGDRLGCGAHVVALRRTSVGGFSEKPVTMDQLESAKVESFQQLDDYLMGMDTAVSDWPDIRLSSDLEFYVKQGQPVMVPKAPANGFVRLYGASDDFIGVGVINDDGKVAPKRLIIS